MTPTQWFVVVIVLGVLALVALDRLRVDVGAMLIAALLGMAQFLGLGVLAAPHTPERGHPGPRRAEPAGRDHPLQPVRAHPRPG